MIAIELAAKRIRAGKIPFRDLLLAADCIAFVRDYVDNPGRLGEADFVREAEALAVRIKEAIEPANVPA